MAEAGEHKHSGYILPEKVLVTGSTGFIGGHVTRYLAGKGIKVTCLVRETGDRSFIRDLPVTYFTGDITDLKGLQKAFRGQDAVIHTAGMVNDWGKYESFYQDNVRGTLNVLQAALDNSIKKIVITGSVSSYGEEDFTGVKDENSPFNSHYPYWMDGFFASGMNHYRDTKALMTDEALAFAQRHGMDLVIIEPVWVYGENEFNTGFYEYVSTVKSGLHFMPGSRKNTFHVIYAGELARLFYLAISTNLNGIHRIIAGNEQAGLMSRIFPGFCEEAGLKKPTLLPKGVTYPIGFMLEMLYTLFRAKNPPILTRARVNMFYDSNAFDTSKAGRLLDFTNEVPLEEGIRRTIQWYQENNYL